ncbi:phospholipase D-like domain-containing protein [Geomesophilobacter sediminis]|uniref:Phospholipase n=1 Tax=Geomesophilobacter sediminis TaxID=2798584 RepID=A0A8J7M0R0_9BACT|nr:phospholipase D-like domain-containing protein [Geomesophilobacter sediminis]MBJ6726488.1 phospholipase [Geomesophilobacter sediminis]
MTILKEGVNCLGTFPTDRCSLLVDGADYYRAFYLAARKARRYILLAGWQFDTEVRLLRNSEAEGKDVQFLHVLERLCAETPELEIYLLAWDFSLVFTMEREWFQSIVFNWTTNQRIHFLFDANHAVGATHHQKFVVIDGEIAFLGGMDICSARWDDRYHREENPGRTDIDGNPYGSYHDVQTYLTGAVVRELVDLFAERWGNAGGGALSFPAVPEASAPEEPPGALPMGAERVALSRTRARCSVPPLEPVHEIRRLFIDAILAADSLIYLENQYFSSHAIYWTLISRMSAPGRSRLQIVMVLPERLPFTEELFLGVPQMKMLLALQRIARETGHRLGLYSTRCSVPEEGKMTFIHSKLLLVDDRFLTVGSANLTNRSMGLDTELNVSWEADPEREPGLAASIRQVRCSLLAEHAGWFGMGREDEFSSLEGLWARLEKLADDPQCRLCRYAPEKGLEGKDLYQVLEPVTRVVDPERPLDEEFLFEEITRQNGAFAKGILVLSHLISVL